MFCHNCGMKLEEGSVFCPECGTRQIDADMPGNYSGAQSKTGGGLEEDFNTDISDESELEDFEMDMPDESEQKTEGKGKGLIAGIILIIVLGIAFGVGGFFVYQKISSSDSKETEVVKEETEKEAAGNSEKKKTEETNADKNKDGEGSKTDEDNEGKAEEQKPKEKTYIHEYTVVQGIRTWSDAKAYCEIQGGHLATVVSQEEYDQITAKADETGCVVLWLGAERMGDGEFAWVTGEEFSFDVWASGEPNNDGGNENYLGMMKIQGIWSMYDMPNDVSAYYGSDKVGFVMEKDIEKYHE